MVARNRVVLSGSLGSVERWSIGVNFILDGGGAVLAPTDLQTWADNLADFLDGWDATSGQPATALATGSDLDRVDIYGYGPTGPAIAQATATCAFSGNGAIRAPFQTAVVCGLQTDRAGRSYRGRFYWPALGLSTDVGGKHPDAPGLAQDFAELLVAMGNIDGTSTAIPVVYSPTKNEVTPVTSVRVGDVLDTQRRRRDAIQETYSVVQYTP